MLERRWVVESYTHVRVCVVLPRVMVIRDEKGNPMMPHKLLDLAREPKAAKGEPYRILGTLEYGSVPFNPDELFTKVH